MSYPPEELTRATTYSQDGGEIIQRYDLAMEDYLTIPISLAKGQYRFSRGELERMTVDNLQALCAERNRHVSDIEDHMTLVRISLNTQRIPVAFSTPSVPFSDPRLITGKRSQQTADVSVHYPMIVMTRQEIAPDGDRNQVGSLRKVFHTDNGDQILMSKIPTPVILRYQIELISLYQSQINSMDASVLRGFGIRDSIIKVDHGIPWGERIVFIGFDSGYSDTTDFEQQTSSVKRIFRHVYSADVKGWIPQKARMVRTVREVVSTFKNENSHTGRVDTLLKTLHPDRKEGPAETEAKLILDPKD